MEYYLTLINIDFMIKLVTVVMVILWSIYWQIAEKAADLNKPKTKKPTLSSYVRSQLTTFFGIFFAVQLLGIEFFPMGKKIGVEITGFVMVIIGVSIAVAARIVLSDNWSHAAEYQIRKNQKLVTKGIYAYIRHPIYTGLLLAMTGMELVVGSYLFIPILFLNLFISYTQGKKEEKLLINHFGDDYKKYMRRSRMLFPFVF